MSAIFYWALLFVTCAFAFGRGRQDEQFAASVCLAGSVITFVAHVLVRDQYVSVEAGDMLIDLAVLGAFIALALYSERFWPLWIAGLQLTSSLAHFLKALDPGLVPIAYAAAARFWSYPILLIILIGAWRSSRRNASDGWPDPA